MICHLRKHTIRTLVPIVLTLLFCIACGEKKDQTESDVLRVVSTSFLAHAPIFIAQEEGYFTEQDLEVEFVQMVSSGHAVPALVEGDVDIIPGAVRISVLNAMVRGAKVGFVADFGHASAGDCFAWALVARPALAASGELEGPAQLKGRRIATNPSVHNGYFLEKLLNTAGMTLDDVDIVNIPFAARPEALEKGSVDLATSSEPWTTRMRQAGQAVIWMSFQQVIPDFQQAVIMYGPTLLVKNPDAGRRFMVAYLKAVRQYNEGKTSRNIEILAKNTGLDDELLRDCCWPPIRSDGRINLDSVLDFQRWGLEKGLLDKQVPIEQFWNPSFVEHACQVLDLPIR
jgi:NitT/TauT family transport system substrate-binding protein